MCDNRADTILTSSAVSPATKRQIGVFQRTIESSSDNRGFRVIARTKASTRRSRAARASSAVTAGSDGADSAAEGAGGVSRSAVATFEQHNPASAATLKAEEPHLIDRLTLPASGINFSAREVAQPPSSNQ